MIEIKWCVYLPKHINCKRWHVLTVVILQYVGLFARPRSTSFVNIKLFCGVTGYVENARSRLEQALWGLGCYYIKGSNDVS